MLLVALTFAAYANTFRCPFVFDDDCNIVDNRSIRQLWPVWRVFVESVREGVPVRNRPLVNFSLALNYATGGLDPLHYHLTNIAIHALAGLVLFGLVRRTLALPALRERYGAVVVPLAFVIAAVWALHPLQTQAVTYVIQRCETMMGLFFLLSLYCVVLSEGSVHSRRWQAAAVLACLAAMGCKEVAVSAPLVILLYDRAFLAGSFGEAWRRRRGMYAGLGTTWLALGVLLLWSGGPVTASRTAGFADPGSSARYAQSQFGVILHYLRLSFWPDPLVFDYNWPVARTASEIVPGLLVVGGLLAATVYALFRWPKWGTLGAWFFLILAPTSSIMPIADLAFEHRMYLSLAAVVVGVVIMAHEEAMWLSSRLHLSPGAGAWMQFVPAMAVLAVLGTATFVRNQAYRSESSIWEDVVQKVPGNVRAHYNLAFLANREGRVEEAIARYQRTLEIEPGHFLAHTNLANVLYAQGRIDEAITYYQKALEVNPELAEPHFNLGNIFRWQGKADAALAHYEKALAIDPKFAEAHINLANLLYKRGKVEEAVAHYRKALQSKPASAQVETNLAVALSTLGEIDEAIAHCQAAVAIDPLFPEAHCELGKALFRKGRSREALDHWFEAIRLRPQDLATVNVLARVLAASPDSSLRNGAEAVKLAEHAVRLSGARVPELIDTLGAAYAEVGRFADALQAAHRALELASEQKNVPLAKALEATIRLYQAKTPLRDARSPLEQPVQSPRGKTSGMSSGRSCWVNLRFSGATEPLVSPCDPVVSDTGRQAASGPQPVIGRLAKH